jgi:tetratricopeptide (TPR) repeat protein
LIDVRFLKLAGPFDLNGQLAELADMETLLAWRILALQDSSFTVGSEEDFRRQFPPLRLDAHENYIRGIMSIDSETRVRFLTEANRRDPSDYRAAFELARFYYENKDYESSAKWLRVMAGADGDRFEVRFIKGVNEFFLGREAAAEKTFAELSRDVPIAEVWNNLGFLQSHLGRWVEATASFDRGYQADPSDPDFSFNLGVCMWNLKRYTVAIRYLQEALQFAPEDPEIHRLLRESLAATGDADRKKKEDQWLEARDENLTNGTATAILPNPRLKKQFNRRAYRQLMLAGHAAKEARVLAAPAAVEAKP